MILPKRRKPEPMGLREAPQLRNASHLKWLRGAECAIAGRAGHECRGKIESAHVRTGTDGGTGVKPSDCYAIPLCSEAHAIQHSMGETSFQAKYGINMLAIAAALWRMSPHRKKSEES